MSAPILAPFLMHVKSCSPSSGKNPKQMFSPKQTVRSQVTVLLLL